ncbi:FliO/MopB family protein [Lachnobacterium bovis]|uniref:Flagellar protein FliO/FliZ n=1 Tax=Lachnobacterium bovis DSM 14045 TaxID=1122142 RepID=A0A1H3EXV0_9FIRM|nr:flagellar biosynthetic protein FliO [Lachnobacterium bovis]SDX83632.1 flagellar protein FliO/FliZ [Lachnobacterium bovis DSM 14045]
MSTIESFIQLIGVLLIFLIVLAMAYYVTKWLAKYEKIQGHNSNLDVVEATKIGTNKAICLIRIGEKYIVVAIGKDNVTYLTEVKKDELTDLSFLERKEIPKPEDSFQEILAKIKEKIPKKQE